MIFYDDRRATRIWYHESDTSPLQEILEVHNNGGKVWPAREWIDPVDLTKPDGVFAAPGNTFANEMMNFTDFEANIAVRDRVQVDFRSQYIRSGIDEPLAEGVRYGMARIPRSLTSARLGLTVMFETVLDIEKLPEETTVLINSGSVARFTINPLFPTGARTSPDVIGSLDIYQPIEDTTSTIYVMRQGVAFRTIVAIKQIGEVLYLVQQSGQFQSVVTEINLPPGLEVFWTPYHADQRFVKRVGYVVGWPYGDEPSQFRTHPNLSWARGATTTVPDGSLSGYFQPMWPEYSAESHTDPHTEEHTI